MLSTMKKRNTVPFRMFKLVLPFLPEFLSTGEVAESSYITMELKLSAEDEKSEKY